MKKWISLLLCAALAVFGAGCGVDTAPETTTAETQIPEIPYESEPVQKKYQDVQLVLAAMVEETDPQAQVICQAAQVFEKQTGAQVTVEWASGNRETADIFQLPLEKLTGETLSGALDLTQLAQDAGYDACSFPALRQQVTAQCGYLAGIAQTPYLSGVYYNRDVFAECGIAEAPESWEAFLTVCAALRSGGYSPLALNNEGAVLAARLHLHQAMAAQDEEQLAQATQQILDLAAGGDLAEDTPAAAPEGQNKLGLYNGAMTVGSNALCAQVEEASQVQISWGVFAWPGGGTGSVATADVLCVRKDCVNAQAAFDFIMLLCTGEFDQLRADVTGGIPADPDNASPIAGAVETLLAAQPQTALLGTDALLKLWTGGYGSGAAFAAAWLEN